MATSTTSQTPRNHLRRNRQPLPLARALLQPLESRVLLTTTYGLVPSLGVVAENAGSLGFAITRSGTLPVETVFVSTLQGAANNLDDNNGDFDSLATLPVAFAANQTTANFSIPINDDAVSEPNELFAVEVQRSVIDPVSTFLARTSFTITDNDGVTSSTPVGFLDIVNRQTIAGWGFDGDAGANPVQVRIDIDGVPGAPFPANLPRPDLIAYPPVGTPNHGFRVAPQPLSSAAHRVSLMVQNVPGGTFKQVDTAVIPALVATSPPALPRGFIDIADQQRIAGWAFDPNAGATSVIAQLYIDGRPQTPFVAKLSRPDLVSAPGIGSPLHGFDVTIPGLPSGVHTIDLYVQDFPATRMVKVASKRLSPVIPGNAPPMGWIDIANRQEITGWGFDPDAAANPVVVRVDIDGVQGTPFLAQLPRPDLTDVATIGSPNHGFTLNLPGTLSPGSHRVALFVQDVRGLGFIRVANALIPAVV